MNRMSCYPLGQIDGQEVSCAAILPQRPVARPPRRSPPPRGPPPRWGGRRNSPPRYRDRRR